ncbi:MAG: hypothetical protein J6P67_06225 [Bacteroidaceae bacterium]|nr:hypothetical protein [Bacteroidaceae bacterium]
MGRNKYSQSEIGKIAKLLRMKCKANRLKQKEIRHELRTKYEFNISDFNEPGKSFGPDELYAAIDRKAIQILDDATIADMIAKRERDKQKDMAAKAAEAKDEQTDWQQALKEWKEWEENGNVNL